jgi:hypothetical protein
MTKDDAEERAALVAATLAFYGEGEEDPGAHRRPGEIGCCGAYCREAGCDCAGSSSG